MRILVALLLILFCLVSGYGLSVIESNSARKQCERVGGIVITDFVGMFRECYYHE